MNLTHGDTELIIATCKARGLLRNQCAYVLATAWHESAHTMKPVKEMGGENYLRSKSYYPYVGRGYVQLTWRANYEKAGKKLGVDFVKRPDLLMVPSYAARILVIGMEQGWFTGKKLSDYITLKHSDYSGARRIVNGTDRANVIAAHARVYDLLLKGAGYGGHTAQSVSKAIPTPAKAETAPTASPVAANGICAALAAFSRMWSSKK